MVGMELYHWLRRYMDHPEPHAAAANWVAMVVGWNTPFYPLYLLAMPGSGIFPAGWLTLIATPFFLAVPAVMRRSTLAGRLMVPGFGAANCVFGSWVLGAQSGTLLFLVPCAILAALLYRPNERLWRLGLLGAVLAAFLVCTYWLPSLTKLAPDTLAAITRLNSFSMICLISFIALIYAPLMGNVTPTDADKAQ
jgi:hypothetical protein